jgi:type II secretory pathway pseudopilin PulG
MRHFGFTLIETIVYLALFSMLMSGGVISLHILLADVNYNRGQIALQAEALFINSKLDWALTGAANVSALDNETLLIIRPDLAEQSPLTVRVHDQQFLLKRNNTAFTPLTSPRYRVHDVSIVVTEVEVGETSVVDVTYHLNNTPFFYTSLISIEP